VTLEDLANLGELVGGIAVVLSLLYLAVQIRQNTRALRGAAHETASSRTTHYLTSVTATQEINELWVRADSDPASVSESELFRYHRLLAASLGGIETVYWQYKRGNIEPEIWERWDRILRRLLRSPGVQHAWKQDAIPVTSAFAEVGLSRLLLIFSERRLRVRS